MIIVYEVIDDEAIDRIQGEASQQVKLRANLPIPGDQVYMGGKRLWQVVKVELYSGSPHNLALALVHPVDAAILSRAVWNQTMWREEYPAISIDIRLMPDGAMHYCGSNMKGEPTTGRQEGAKPTSHPTLLEPYPLPWIVTTVESYRPREESSYTAIHLCHWEASPLPEMAVA